VRVLVVEDERLLADAVADGLRAHRLAVDTAYDGGAALERLAVNGLRLDGHRREAWRDGRPVSLAPKEFAVLEELLRAGGGVVSAERLLEKAWDEHTDPFTNTVRVTVMKLRRKLGEPAAIQTVPGAGYQIP
jgi:DNA-binding response OmpR family regulator